MKRPRNELFLLFLYLEMDRWLACLLEGKRSDPIGYGPFPISRFSPICSVMMAFESLYFEPSTSGALCL